MTQPVQEVTPERAQAATDFRVRQLARRPPLISQSCCPITFRAAIQSVEGGEDGTNRIHYPSAQGGDNVYFDTWDTTFDTSVFGITDWDFTDPLTGLPSIAGVTLKAPGIYNITGQVDVNPVFNGAVTMKSNYDDGEVTYYEALNITIDAGAADDLFLSDTYAFRLDHQRFIWVENFEDAVTDEWDTESNCEIIFAQNNNADLVIYGGVGTAGTQVSVGDPFISDADVWIPGGSDGSLGPVPYMLVTYHGLPDWDPDWPTSFPPFGT